MSTAHGMAWKRVQTQPGAFNETDVHGMTAAPALSLEPAKIWDEAQSCIAPYVWCLIALLLLTV